MYNNTLQVFYFCWQITNFQKYLHLFGNKITDEGAVSLLAIIQDHNQTLLGLSISEDNIENIEILDVQHS